MATILRVLVFASIGWNGIQILLVGARSRAKGVGRPPIAWPALLLAKIAVGVSLGLMFWRAISSPQKLPPLPAGVFLLLIACGTFIFTHGMWQLGRNLRVGLPDEETFLVVTGIYRFTRNPIYLAIFSLMGASLIYAFSWVNLAAALTGAMLHHRIVLAEERFLMSRFPNYADYRRRVRRYA